MSQLSRTFFKRRSLARSVFCALLALFVCLTSCTTATPALPATDLLGVRTATDPLTVAEGYLRQYQPGPLPRIFQTTRLFDRHGALLAELYDEGRRTWVPITAISPALINATVATEDATFFQNSGIDPRRILSALLRNTQAGEVVSGASTITMQLARNLFLGPDQRYDQALDRKILEAGLAQELTKLYSKNDLLEMYLNLLNYGNLAYGPEAAAQLYFGKTAADLTLAEATLLAGIPQAPAILDPYTNWDAVRARQRIVLDLMVRHDFLQAFEADFVFAQPLTLQEHKRAMPNLAPHFVQFVVNELTTQLGDEAVARAGFQITTTLDLPMQQLAQEIVRSQVAALRPAFDLSNAALIALKPNSGEILTMVGSADFADVSIAGQVNVATSLRQPGSAIKPVLYATAFNDNLISPATVLWDIPVTYTVGPGQVYTPRNYDNIFHGPVTVRTALANSYNIPAVKLLAGVGVARMLQSARTLGIKSLQQPAEFYGLSLTLGGGDVTLLDLTTAYHTLASDGTYRPPHAIQVLSDGRGNQSTLALPPPTSVLTPAAAFLVTDILSDNAARTPAFGAQNLLTLSRPAAAKTGTTTDFRDNWTIGYTRYLVAGVWAGNSDGHPMRNTSGVTGAAPIWHEFMQRVLDSPALLATLAAPDDPAAWTFPVPETVALRPDCPPGTVCRTGGEYFAQEWLAAAGERGPLADSVEQAATAPVYVESSAGGRLIGFCTMAGAAERSLLRMPGQLGLPAPVTPTLQLANGGALAALGDGAVAAISDALATERLALQTDANTDANTDTNTDTNNDAEQSSQARLQALAWALQYSAPLHLGDCAALQATIPQAITLSPLANAGARILVDLGAANTLAVAEFAGAGALEIAAINPALIGNVQGPGYFALAAPIVNDANCPGQYVMGQVLSPSGGGLPGVRIRFRDEWGNEASAVSKSGASDFGQFDFVIPAGSPHEFYLWVVDEAGNPISPTITVQHRRGDGGDAPCHHVVIQGG